MNPYLLTPPSTMDPYLNLSREELCFENFDPETPLLLLYINSPAVVVGKNQNPWREAKVQRLFADGIPLVRRITGGGTVWHDEGNLNFSLMCSPRDYNKETVQHLLGRVLDHLGVPWTSNPHGDFFARERKFSGHAYAVKKDRVLHHGTLLVSADLVRLRNYLGGLKEISGPGVASRPSPVINLSEVLPHLTVSKVVQGFQDLFHPGQQPAFTPEALDLRAAERRDKEWILGFTPDFTWPGPRGIVKVQSGRVAGPPEAAEKTSGWFCPEE